MKSIKMITKASLYLAILPSVAFADEGVNVVVVPDGEPAPYCYAYDCYYGNGYYYGDYYYSNGQYYRHRWIS